MADSEVQILISLKDEVSEGFKNIEKMFVNGNKKIEEANKDAITSFQKQTNSLIAVGNAASSVESIMSSYQNLQLRLENSSERVANAQDRLVDAQYNLKKIQSNSASTAEDLAHAQDMVDRATRALTISENNQARTQGQVLGTYIQMGVQSIKLIQSLPVLTGEVKALAIQAGIADAALLPLSVTLGAVALIGIQVYSSVKDITEASKNAAIAEKNLADATAEANDKLAIQKGAIDDVYNAVNNIFGNKSNQELATQKEIANMEARKAELYNKRAQNSGKLSSAEWEELRVIGKQLEGKQLELDMYVKRREAGLADVESFKAENMAKSEGLNEVSQIMAGTYDAQKKYIKDNYYDQLMAYEDAYQKKLLQRIDILNQTAVSAKGDVIKSGIKAVGNIFPFLPQGAAANIFTAITSKKKVNDAIITKTGQVIETSPDDNIFASKGGFGGGGISIEISGNIYGTDPKDLSQALAKELGKKLSL